MSVEQKEVLRRVIPLAYLDDVSGRKYLIHVVDSNKYTVVSPPNYQIADNLDDQWLVTAVIAKYGFVSCPDSQKEMALSELKDFYC